MSRQFCPQHLLFFFTEQICICSPISHQDDGFDVCAINSLDGLFNESGDWSAEKSDSDPESNPCPLVLTTLMSRSVVLDESAALKLAAASEGSSPELLAPPASKSRPSISRPSLHLRRCQSLIDPPKRSPEQRKSASELIDFTSPVSRVGFKRPAEPIDCPNSGKKHRPCCENPCSSVIPSRVCVINDTSNMTADGRRRLLLPTVPGSGNNSDLNNVDCHSLADLIRGKYDDQVRSLSIQQQKLKIQREGPRCLQFVA